ncbi:MAG: SDR family oxidoreductase, partial [Verrucomicrobiota bacterium]
FKTTRHDAVVLLVYTTPVPDLEEIISASNRILPIDLNDTEDIATCLNDVDRIDAFYFISSTDADELPLLRLVKHLQERTPPDASVDGFIVTRHVGGNGVAGLAYAIAQGDHRFRIRNMEWGAGADPNMIPHEAPSERGDLVRLESGRRYEQSFHRLDWGAFAEKTGFRQGGVYVILGGAGSIGRAVTRSLKEHYEATVIWLGRSHRDEATQYIQADVTDRTSIEQAVRRIKQTYGAVHGAIFAGAVFDFENTVRNTSEETFSDIFDVKAKGSRHFYEAFKDEPLDFMCFFSSAQAFSFSGAATLSAYASGITWSDRFVRSLEGVSTFPVGIVNWGFWKTSEDEAWNAHVGYLEAHEGFACLERFTAGLREGRIRQVLCLKRSDAVRRIMKVDEKELVSLARPGSGFEVGSIDDPESMSERHDPSAFDEHLAQLLLAQLHQLGAFECPGTVEELRVRAGVIDTYARWWDESLSLLEGHGFLVSDAGKIILSESADVHGASIDSDESASAALVDACLRSLPEILSGRIPATEVLFPKSSMDRVEQVYKSNTLSEAFNNITAQCVVSYVQQCVEADPDVRLRLIEIGAGTGGTTSKILPALTPFASKIEEYCFSDISQAFLMHAEETYASDYPWLTCRLWNIEEQDIELGTYDLVIAANVLHATANIRRTLRNAKSALREGGLMVLNEISDKSLFGHLTFGLLDGWWLYEDAELRIP